MGGGGGGGGGGGEVQGYIGNCTFSTKLSLSSKSLFMDVCGVDGLRLSPEYYSQDVEMVVAVNSVTEKCWGVARPSHAKL